MKCEVARPLGKALLTIVEGICRHPDTLQVFERDNEGDYEIEFMPHMADYRLLVGKGGRQVKAMQHLAFVAGEIAGHPHRVKITESYAGTENEPATGFVPNDEFGIVDILAVLEPLLKVVFKARPPVEIQLGKGKAYVEIDVSPERHTTTVAAIADVLYPYGFRQGRKIQVWVKDPRKLSELLPTK